MGDCADNCLGEIPLPFVQDDVELDPVSGKLFNVFHVDRGTSGSGIGFRCDVFDSPVGQVDRLFPPDDLRLFSWHSGVIGPLRARGSVAALFKWIGCSRGGEVKVISSELGIPKTGKGRTISQLSLSDAVER